MDGAGAARGGQLHHVDRLTLDIEVDDFATATDLRARAEDLARRLIPRTLAKLLDGMIPASLHVRLDRIDLDLGTIAPDRLEAELPEALARALEKTLGDQIATARAAHRAGGAETASDGFLSPAVAALGDLDDWFRLGRPRRPGAAHFDPAESIARLIDDDPIALVALLTRHAHDRTAMERLVMQAGEDVLAALLTQLTPTEAATIIGWIAEIGRLRRAAPAPTPAEPALCRSLWVLTFEYLLRDAGSPFNRRSYVAYLLQGIAVDEGISMAALLDLIRVALAPARKRQPLGGSLPGILDELAREPARAREASAPSRDDAFALAAQGDMLPLLALLKSIAHDAVALAECIARLTPALFAAAVTRLEPVHAVIILAYVEGLTELHRDGGVLPRSRAALTRTLRMLVLHYLLRDSGTQFNRRQWLRRLLGGLATAIGVDYVALLALLADELDLLRKRLPPSGSLPASIATLAADLPERAAPSRVRTREAGDATALTTVDLAALSPAAFTRLVATLRPADAIAIRADLADLLRLHRRLALTRLSDTAFAARLRKAAISALPHGDASFDRADWLRRLLITLTGETTPSVLTAILAGASREGLRALAAADDAGFAAALAQAGPAAAAALGADLALLRRRHGARPLLPVDDAIFTRLATAMSLAVLTRRPSFDRAAMRAAWADAFAPSDPASDWAGWTATAADRGDGLAYAERLLRGGDADDDGSRLAAIATADPRAFVALLRRLAVAASGRSEALVARLLLWLTPDEAAALLWPGDVDRPAHWAAALAARDGTSLGGGWIRLFGMALRGEVPDVAAAPSPGIALDDLALLRAWLDDGQLPWWASLDQRIEPLLAGLRRASDAALARLFDDPDAKRAASRVRRALDRLTAADGEALLRRIAPWMAAPVDPQGDVAPATAPAAAPQATGDRAEVDAAILAWLAGEGPERPAGLDRMLRRLAARIDRGDHRLDEALHRLAGLAPARRRWADLPDEIYGRLLHRLLPGQAALILDLIAILARAQPRGATPGGGDPLTRLRLAALSLPSGALTVRAIAARLIGAIVPAPGAATGLRTRAALLAQTGGDAHLAAALRPSPEGTPRSLAATDRKAADPEPGDTIYIANAGLVLFNPFLPRFFEQIGLLSGDTTAPQIAPGEAASRAVHLLQYLVDERCDMPEPALALNKLLCGLPIAMPVERAIDPSQADLAVCAAVIGAVMGNWPAIANSSVAALRETFLQRDGRLRYDGDRWTLDVERKTVDVLTDQIPWNRVLVFHKWMAVPLHVTW